MKEHRSVNADPSGESSRALRVLAIGLAGGLVAIVVFAAGASDLQHFPSVASTGLLIAAAAALVGAALGFLFGIPRTLQQGAPGEEAVDSPPRADANAQVGYRVNTNLEQISDWLTKILVGVGLTQIGALPSQLGLLSTFLARGLALEGLGQVFAAATIVYYAITGFLFGYLWTRLFLAGALRQADLSALGTLVQEASARAAEVDKKLDALALQSQRDADALNLAYRLMNPSAGTPAVEQGPLEAAIAQASVPVKVQLFNQAWQLRGESWRDPTTKERMESTIPIFRALVAADVEGRFHTNHGQLGFALKDQRAPDWSGAADELTKAIEIRGPWQEKGWVFYEFNRAVCRIHLDPNFQQDLASSRSVADAIVADLRVAATARDIWMIIHADEVVQRWLQLNKVAESDLRT